MKKLFLHKRRDIAGKLEDIRINDNMPEIIPFKDDMDSDYYYYLTIYIECEPKPFFLRKHKYKGMSMPGGIGI